MPRGQRCVLSNVDSLQGLLVWVSVYFVTENGLCTRVPDFLDTKSLRNRDVMKRTPEAHVFPVLQEKLKSPWVILTAVLIVVPLAICVVFLVTGGGLDE